MLKSQRINFLVLIISALFFITWNLNSYAEEGKEEPIILNADKIEYATDGKELIATGNAEVIYKGSRLTSQKLTLNTKTKEGEAEGNARLDDKSAIIEGDRIIYNFDTNVGTIINAKFRANPYFGKSKRIDKVSASEFVSKRGYVTTCSFDRPHYRMAMKKMSMFPGDKIQIRENTVFFGDIPTIYMPQYSHTLKDPLMHVQLLPGNSKAWGPYLLTGWRVNLTDYINGRIYLDYRGYLGISEGFGTNYTSNYGKGDFKFYYTQERDKSKDVNQEDVMVPKVFQRYFIRLRHKWVIDERTDMMAEFYRIIDSKMFVIDPKFNILKDYFFREYEKDEQPPSYLLLHHSSSYASVDVQFRKRTNRWYAGYLETLPEIRLSLPSFNLMGDRFYFDHSSSMGNYNKKNTSTLTPAANDTNPNVHVNRLDTTNKFSFPLKLLFIQLTPFVSSRQTFYSEDVNGDPIAPRTIFSSGTDMSTKFYRIFNVKSNFLGMDINGLRHIITPTTAYNYSHVPTILNTKLKQIDGVDSISATNNSASLGLSNKLQTKRKGQSMDLVDFNVTNTYTFKPKTGDNRGSSLGDFSYDLKILPYSWLRMEATATYKHSGNRSDTNYKKFTNVNYDLSFVFSEERIFKCGQRYQRKGGNQIVYQVDWRLNPKWKFGLYHRKERGHDPTLKRGLREQEYFLSRDFHCWAMEFNWNIKKTLGETIWLVFRLKAFPKMEFDYNQEYHMPKPGSQSPGEAQ